jgi:rare lipoprotein A
MSRAVVVGLIACLTGCGARDDWRPAAAPEQLDVARRPPPPPFAPYQIGTASYYHDSLAGNLTANGERYDPRALTAAHRTLPLGTIVDVVRRDGRLVRVRINDRGPYVAGRIIDLSRRAASTIGMIRAGITDVALYVVWSPPPRRRGKVAHVEGDEPSRQIVRRGDESP